MGPKAVLFDFSKVLSRGLFYGGLGKVDPERYERLQTEIFAPPATICDRWMRNELTRHDINRHLSGKLNLPEGVLNRYLLDSVQHLPLDQDLIGWAKELKEAGRPTAIVTDNMDTFSAYTVPALGLDKIFPVIVSSADHRILKKDQNGRLFQIAREKLELPDFRAALLVDDSPKNCELFQRLGGQAVVYKEFADVAPWRDKI